MPTGIACRSMRTCPRDGPRMALARMAGRRKGGGSNEHAYLGLVFKPSGKRQNNNIWGSQLDGRLAINRATNTIQSMIILPTVSAAWNFQKHAYCQQTKTKQCVTTSSIQRLNDKATIMKGFGRSQQVPNLDIGLIDHRYDFPMFMGISSEPINRLLKQLLYPQHLNERDARFSHQDFPLAHFDKWPRTIAYVETSQHEVRRTREITVHGKQLS